MGVALVTAVGAVIVAVIGLIGARLGVRDARARLQKDVELLSKLNQEHEARAVWEEHVTEAMMDLAHVEKMRRTMRRATYFAAISGCYAAIAAFLRLLVESSNGKPPGEFLRNIAEPASWLFLVTSSVGLALMFLALWRDRNR